MGAGLACETCRNGLLSPALRVISDYQNPTQILRVVETRIDGPVGTAEKKVAAEMSCDDLDREREPTGRRC